MGRRHTPEKRRGGGTVCGAERGTDATVKARSNELMKVLPNVTHEGQAVLGGNSVISQCHLSAAKASPAVRAALVAIRFYKTNLAVWFGGSCRFQPTCSQYAYEAIERFGVLRGTWLGLKRLLRCHPFSRRFGLDPVPDATHKIALAAARHDGAHS